MEFDLFEYKFGIKITNSFFLGKIVTKSLLVSSW